MDIIDQNKLLDAGFSLFKAKYDKGWVVYIKKPSHREWHIYKKPGSKEKLLEILTDIRKEFTYIDIFNIKKQLS